MQKFRLVITTMLGGFVALALVARSNPARGQTAQTVATVDLMKIDWKYAPCKTIKDGNQAGFTWVADGIRRSASRLRRMAGRESTICPPAAARMRPCSRASVAAGFAA